MASLQCCSHARYQLELLGFQLLHILPRNVSNVIYNSKALVWFKYYSVCMQAVRIAPVTWGTSIAYHCGDRQVFVVKTFKSNNVQVASIPGDGELRLMALGPAHLVVITTTDEVGSWISLQSSSRKS